MLHVPSFYKRHVIVTKDTPVVFPFHAYRSKYPVECAQSLQRVHW